MVQRKVTAVEKVAADPASLRWKLKRDPRGYYQEFHDVFLVYDAQKQIFLSNPANAPADEVKKFTSLLDLIAHVADEYPELTAQYPDDLKTLLIQHHAVLDVDLREKLVGCLVLLRRKSVITSETLLTTLFPVLVSTPSKSLRQLLYQKILSDLRESNKTAAHRLNSTIATVLHNLITSDRTSGKGIWAVRIIRELWRRQVPGWRVARPVQVMQEACLADNHKVVVGGVRFFLGADKTEDDEDDSSDEDAPDLKKIKHQTGVNKKTKKRAKAYDKALEKVKKQERKKTATQPLNFSALHLLNDPQGFVEQLFQKHLMQKSKMTLENKLLVLSLVTRLIGTEKLQMNSLYSWFTKYLSPKQQNVTGFLASLAQATHNLVPPESVSPLIRKIADEFVNEASASEVAASGLNAIREICFRQPLAIDETLLSDLVGFSRSKDKGVAMAAKGLQSLYREVHPELLQKKHRGKAATIGLRSGGLKQRKFGEEEGGTIEGIELLEAYKEEQKKLERAEKGDEDKGSEDDEDDFNSSDWELGSSESDDDSDDSVGWIDVSSESEADEPSSKRRRTDSEVSQLVDDKEQEEGSTAAKANRISELATTSILTPADLAKLEELRREAKVDRVLGGSGGGQPKPQPQISKRKRELLARHIEEGLTAEDIELPARLAHRSTKEERVARAREGKPEREEHKSTQAIRRAKKDAEGKSSTNREKARRKNFLMTVGKGRAKNKRSLVETRKTLQAHVKRSKSGGRRRNGM